MIEPPSRQRRGATGGRAAGHQDRLDGTLRKNGSALAVVGFFVDERAGGRRCPATKAESPKRGRVAPTRLGLVRGRQALLPAFVSAASYRRTLFELAGNAAERAVQLCAKGVHDGDNCGGYAGGNEAVFNGGRTSLIIHETQDKLSHGQPPLRFLAVAATTMWRSAFDRVNAIAKNVDDARAEYPCA